MQETGKWRDALNRLPSSQRGALGLLLAFLALVQIDSPYPETAWLHHVPTLVAILVAPRILARWPMSDGAVLAILLFLALHTLGGRYTYSNVPYDAWTRALFSGSLSEAFGWHRNHYDRLVHFGCGALFYAPVREAAMRHGRQGRAMAAALALGFVIAVGALYELFEWGLTMMVAPELADDYNGQQGDPWDAQKDMAIALLGALIAAGWVWAKGGKRWPRP